MDREFRVSGRVVRIARLDAEKFHFLEGNPQEALQRLRTLGRRIDLFTFIQGVADPRPKYSYPMEWDNFAALSVSTFDHWWTKQIGFKARNKAKQAEKKGVVIQEVPFSEDLVRGIWEIYNECPVRQGRRFPHYGKSIESVRSEEATYLDCSIFIGAFFEDKLIGFVKLIFDRQRSQAGLLNIVSLVQHRDKSPTNALVAYAVRACAERSVPFLTYANFSYGKKQKDSLSDFKERNGFQKIEVPRYYVPLTSFGRIALRFGMHHRIADRIPEPVADRLRRVREEWYRRRFPSQMAEQSL